jgi:membrane-associated phospholipid phosphatase
MLDSLIALDTALFRFVNITLANPVFDAVMPFVTNGEHWVIAAVLMAAVLLHAERGRGVWIAVGVAVVFAACDQTSAHLLKPIVARLRPCHVVEGANLLVGCSNAYSFPSAHAANSMGMAVFLTYVFPKWRWVFFGLCGLMSISRVFVGVHYPFDIVGGWVIGVLAGFALIGLVKMYLHRQAAVRDN